MRRRRCLVDRVFPEQGACRGKLAMARSMRRESTEGEAVLWAALRCRKLGGWKFRRQHVLEGYIVDFYCAELELAVEVDGPIHDDRSAQDRERDTALAGLGVDTLRVLDVDVRTRLGVVLVAVSVRCESLAYERGRNVRGRGACQAHKK